MSRQILRATQWRGVRPSLASVLTSGSVLLAMPGCATHYAPVLVPTLECKLADSLLAGCEAPGAITPDMTYGEMIKLAQGDRQKLARCSLQQQDLASAVRACNQAIAEHNTQLERSNDEQRNKAK